MSLLTFIILCLEGAVLSFNVAAAAALVPSIAVSFGVSQFFAARVIWLYMLPYGLAALLYGPLIRRFDAKKVEIICLFVFSLANLIAAFSREISFLFCGRFLMGVFGASVIPLGMILIARHVKSSKRGKFIGIFFASTFAASLLGLFLSGLIYWRMIFLIPALAGLFLCIMMIIFLPSFKAEAKTLKFHYRKNLKSRRVLYIFSYIFLVSLFYHGIQQWLAVYLTDKYCFSQFLVSMLMTLASLSGIFGEVIGGHFSDLLGRLKVVNTGILLMVLAVFLLLIHMPQVLLAMLMIIWGLGWTFNHSGLSTMLTDLPEELLNESASLNSSVRFISGGLGTALAGLLMQKSFILGFSVFGFGLLFLFIFTRKLLIK